jgi:transposase InsO family protein
MCGLTDQGWPQGPGSEMAEGEPGDGGLAGAGRESRSFCQPPVEAADAGLLSDRPAEEAGAFAPEPLAHFEGEESPADELPGDEEGEEEPLADLEPPVRPVRLCAGRPAGRQLVPGGLGRDSAGTSRVDGLTGEQRLLILDTWRRSGLPAGDFAELLGMSKHTLYAWKKRFEEQGPAGLADRPQGRKGSRLSEVSRRSIVMLKQDHPDWGCQRISDVLLRGPGLAASPQAVARVLHEAGYELVERPTAPHPDKVRRFERAAPNQLWQTDLFTFVLKRQNRRVYLVAFMDDHSRFIISYGLHASQSAALVLEVLRAGITSCGTPQEILTDNGSQYVTWRGTSAFAKELQRRGIRQVVASPRRPQTLGKIERFWGTLWRECLAAAVFIDLADAACRIGHFIDYYNFRRPHQGLEGLVPADRFFHLAPQVKQTLLERVTANALDLARHGLPKAPFYLTGQAGGQAFSVHAEGERVILSRPGQVRQEIELTAPPPAPAMPAPVCSQGQVGGEMHEAELPPGVSALDEGLQKIHESLSGSGVEPGGQS